MDEYTFLKNYHAAIKPVAIALKILEANRYTFGIFLPTLVGLRAKLAAVKNKIAPICHPLIAAMQSGFEKRFADVMNIFNTEGKSVPLYIAMVTDPKYKLNFLNMERIPPHIFQQIRKILLNAATDIIRIERENNRKNAIDIDLALAIETNTNTCPDEYETSDDLFIENDVSRNMPIFDEEIQISSEIDSYLSSKSTPDVNEGLKEFPTVAKLYRKYNCIRSTESICERMFSYAGLFAEKNCIFFPMKYIYIYVCSLCNVPGLGQIWYWVFFFGTKVEWSQFACLMTH